ncbi:MAG: NUDIX domain-containing protein [Clostridia bacterium]
MTEIKINKYLNKIFTIKSITNSFATVEEAQFKIFVIGNSNKSNTVRTIAIIEKEDNFTLIGCCDNKKYIQPEIEILAKNIFKNSIKAYFLYEKSCGAIVYYKQNNKLLYLIVKNRDGHFGAPKGHIEIGESEIDTAKREVFEETGLLVEIDETFKTTCNYTVKKFVKKEVVYFIAKADSKNIKLAFDEIGDYLILPFDEMIKFITHDNDKEIFVKADTYLKSLA